MCVSGQEEDNEGACFVFHLKLSSPLSLVGVALRWRFK